MNRLQKLKKIAGEIKEMKITADLGFFNHTLPDKLKDFLILTYIDNLEFQKYLGEYREQLLIDHIQWLRQSNLNMTESQKDFF